MGRGSQVTPECVLLRAAIDAYRTRAGHDRILEKLYELFTSQGIDRG